MALSIKDDEADRLARELASRTGESLTQAVVVSLRERLERVQRAHAHSSSLVEDLMWIGRRNASRQILDARTTEEILGYDDEGLPT
ncbi:MAG: type II toxin-antitoxin system VapB family antitoxin [Candidatus Eremiobacteraeota bacterium]|nr:type II toxin-antitoxin system VapB family antitoxin [Candidatus Eremiobacteraeota bacterium]